MTSITLSNCIDNLNLNTINDERTKSTIVGNCSSDKSLDIFQWPTLNTLTKPARALSFNEEKIASSSNNNRLKYLCTRFKRRFSITKEYRKHSEDLNKNISIHFNNYKSFSSSTDEHFNEFEWPDFEKIYDTIPSCLVKALPGLDDFSIEDDDNITHTMNFITDETNEQYVFFQHCKRGKYFRRNAICRKLDKSQYNRQLDTFIQQLMIEKLMRTWT